VAGRIAGHKSVVVEKKKRRKEIREERGLEDIIF